MTQQSARGDYLIKIVRRWADLYQAVCELSQQREITAADFDPIAELVAPDQFLRTGIYKDESDWSSCVEKYLQFAGTSLWSGKLRWINTVGNLVFQELEETITRPQGKNIINTMTVYEFNENDKVTALRVYYQQEQNEDNVLISGTEN